MATQTPTPKVVARYEYAPGRTTFGMFDKDSRWLTGKDVVAEVTGQEKGWHTDPTHRYKFRIVHTTNGDYRLFPDYSMTPHTEA